MSEVNSLEVDVCRLDVSAEHNKKTEAFPLIKKTPKTCTAVAIYAQVFINPRRSSGPSGSWNSLAEIHRNRLKGKSKTIETYPHGAIERHGNKSMRHRSDSSRV